MLHRGPEGLLHHLPALVVRRPVVSADPTCSVSGMRGSRLLDRRPPHYRCPAVPGPAWRPGDPDGVQFLRSFPLGSITYSGDCVLLVMRPAQRPVTAPLFGSQPRRPSCICSGLEPHCRTSRHARRSLAPLPRDCWYYRLRWLAAPDHRGRPGPVTSPIAVMQPTWLRHSVTAPSCELQLRVLLPGSSSLPGPAVLLAYERNHNHTTTQCLPPTA